MLHINRFNEGIMDRLFSKKGPTKNDLYIHNSKVIHSKSEVQNKDKYGTKEIKNLDINLVKDIKIEFLSKGAIYRDGPWYNSNSNPPNGHTWFDASNVFDNLRNVGSKLGFDINKQVFIKNVNKNSKIVDIHNFCFYEKGYGEINTIHTLVYELEGDSVYYQVSQLELVNKVKDMSIISDEIEDNFWELIEDKSIILKSTKSIIRTSTIYSCSIQILNLSPEMLSIVSSRLVVLSKRLEPKNISVKILSINNNCINFETIQN